MGNRGFNPGALLPFYQEKEMPKYYGEKKGKMSGKGQANMPSGLVMKAYPKVAGGLDGRYYDTSEGLDMMAKQNATQLKKNRKKG